jgi:RNA polymerase sigma-70 factor (ECF subfamily)
MLGNRDEVSNTPQLEDVLQSEWPRLVRLCAHLSGDRDSAEDLAQETLLEAWRHKDRLHDPRGYSAWLSAIASNVSMRWGRRQGRRRSHEITSIESSRDTAVGAGELPAEQGDLTLDLERDELAELLDRALALLPPETRHVLVEKYIEDLPLGAIAERMGLSAGAVGVRLHRGRLALRRVLTSDLRQEFTAYGLPAAEATDWQATRIWCPICGRHRLTGRLAPAAGELALRCPECTPAPDIYIAYAQFPDLMRGIKGFKPALSRLLQWSDSYYRQRLAGRLLPCLFCGHPSLLRDGLPSDIPQPPQQINPLYMTCENCGETASTAHAAIALSLPEGRRFWKAHPRIQLRSSAEVESAGSSAIVSSFASVNGSAHLDVVTTRETVEVVSVHLYP